MEGKELQAYRVGLFRDAARFIKNERIPYFANVVTWKVFDAGHTLDEAMTNFDVMKECVVHFLDNYPCDGLMDTGIRNQFNVTETFGSQGYYYYDKECVGIKDHATCTVDTLMDYIADEDRYVWEKVLPEKYGDEWYQKSKETWKKTFKAYMDYTMFIVKMGSLTGKTYGIPSLAPNNPMSGTISFAVEEMVANLLGIKQMSLAMRRNPEKLDEFIKAWDDKKIQPVIEKIKNGKGPNYKYCFDASVIMLSHNIMSPSQFERFYWPHLEELLKAYEEKDMNIRIFTEGSILRFADYFKDFKKGTLTFHIENDDPYEFREKLPNIAIMGGMTTAMMANATPDECVKYAEQLCNDLGKEGGFILSEGKMVSYRNDAKAENVKAVAEFMRDYRH